MRCRRGSAEKEAKALETYQTALVVVLIACVAALFYLWLKNRSSAAEPVSQELPREAPPVPYSIPDPTPYVPVTETQPQIPSDQHTIYAFEREVQVYVCPRCDGENSVHRNICCICGFEFRKGAWRL